MNNEKDIIIFNKMITIMEDNSIKIIDKIICPNIIKFDVYNHPQYKTDDMNKIIEWCLYNCKGTWTRIGIKFVFDRDDDAMLFKLIWG